MEEKLHTRVLNTLLWNCGGGVFSFSCNPRSSSNPVKMHFLVLRTDSPCFQGYRDVTPVGSASDPHPPSISADDDSLSAFCGSSVGHEIRLPPISYVQRIHTERKQIRRMRSGEKGFSEAERTPAARAQHSPLMTSEDAVFPRIAGETRFSPRRGRWRAPKSYERVMIVWVFRWKARGEEGDRFLYTPTLMWDERTLKFI